MESVNQFSLPSKPLAEKQNEWLRGARSRLLRQADISRRERVLEIGAGWGFTTEELRERSDGNITSVDCNSVYANEPDDSSTRVIARAEELPFRDGSFDLVFAQFTLLWVEELDAVVREMCRVLVLGGVVALIEPDFGGLMEFPASVAVQRFWIDALERAGADPLVGRKLPAICRQHGLRVGVLLPERLEPPDPLRFDLLRELPLNDDERLRVDEVMRESEKLGPQVVAHLPIWLVHGAKV